MSGYVYNPSKKITELLSKYLEFDPEQLQLGIWSGKLSIKDVSLRSEEIYPLLNAHLNKPKTTTSSTTTPTYEKPPLRFKLLSSTIGSLEMEIPWKRLVWGQSDVKLKLHNAVFVVALETCQEAEERAKEKNPDCDELFPDWVGHAGTEESKEEDEIPKAVRRELKQNRLRQAERRHLEGRLTGEWLESSRRKERERLSKLLEERAAEKEEKELQIDRWLRSATKDFFWRFYAGLAMTVENLKIILVQDGIEIGLVIPNLQLNPQSQSIPKFSGHNVSFHEIDDGTGSATTPPENTVYQSAYEDGEHVDKIIKCLGVGVYLHRTSHAAQGSVVGAVIATKDYVLRPVDYSLEFTLFYPHPPEKRKQRKAAAGKDSLDQTATTVGTSDSTSGGSSKRRRGKREKIPVEPSPMESTPPRAQRQTTFEMPEKSGSQQSKPTAITRHARRQSMAYRSTPVHAQTQRHARTDTSGSAPLFRPDDILGAYASATTSSQLTARFDTKLTVGAIEMVFTARQYQLLNQLLAVSIKIRNGRPQKAVKEVVDGKGVRRSLLVSAPMKRGKVSGGPRSTKLSDTGSLSRDGSEGGFKLRLEAVDVERKKVIRSWWRYALRAIVWEIRQRARVRKRFQDTFLSFSWERVRYRRKEYIDLFIRSQLDGGGGFLSRTDEKLHEIEDDLNVEQILLYRSIARAVYVRGGTKMPDSILDVHGGETTDDGQVLAASSRWKGRTTFKDSYLSILDRDCEIARSRRDSEKLSGIPSYSSNALVFEKRLGQPTVGMDETSYAATIDTRAVRSSFTRAKAFEVKDLSGGASNSMLLSFSLNVEKIELTLVNDYDPFRREDTPALAPAESDTSGSSSTGGSSSGVSVLTDDQRFFRDGDDFDESTAPAEVYDETPSSADFLIFSSPQNILLCVAIAPLECSLLARSGGSRNLNLKIGQVDVMGPNKQSMILVGAPVPEIGIEKARGENVGTNRSNQPVPADALSFSFVAEKKGRIFQCDMSVVRARYEERTLASLRQFVDDTKTDVPRKMIPPSKTEQVRMYLLAQNSPPLYMKSLNSSIRMHGFELFFPVQQARIQRMALGEVDEGVFCSLNMLEIYSGSAVASLTDSGPKGRGSSATRSLQMLDLAAKVSSRSSILSHHWVSRQ